MYLQKKPKLAKLFCMLSGTSEKHTSQGYDLFYFGGGCFFKHLWKCFGQHFRVHLFRKTKSLTKRFLTWADVVFDCKHTKKTNGPKFEIGPHVWICFCFEGLVSNLATPGLTMILLDVRTNKPVLNRYKNNGMFFFFNERFVYDHVYHG